MNPNSNPASLPSPPPYPDLQDGPPSPPTASPPLVQTGLSSLVRTSPPRRASLDQHGGPAPVWSSSSSLPGFSVGSPAPVVNPYPAPSSSLPGFSLGSPAPVVDPYPAPSSTLPGFSLGSPAVVNPYPAPSSSCCQVSVFIPDVGSEDGCPDLECSICFSQFNNVFRCPKMLQCQHTFCLECLARINVKSAEPSAIQCPLCRSFTPLPALGLPKLDTDSDVLSCLPAAMQRVYSIRFVRNKGKLQVKRPTDSQRRWGRPSLAHRSLDVGLPSPPAGGGGEASGVGGALFRLTGQPACRAFLLTSVVMMLVMLTGIIIFLLTY